jgi:hypothetical protein
MGLKTRGNFPKSPVCTRSCYVRVCHLMPRRDITRSAYIGERAFEGSGSAVQVPLAESQGGHDLLADGNGLSGGRADAWSCAVSKS